MALITEGEWRLTDSPSHAARRRTPAPGVEVHHTVTGRAADRTALVNIARAIYRDHRRRISSSGNPWADVFYGYLVGDQDLAECRGYGRLSGEIRHLTVALVGNFDRYPPTPFQLQAVADLRRLVIDRGGGDDLTYHGARDGSDCPGRYVIERLPTIGIGSAAPGVTLPVPKIRPRPYPGRPGQIVKRGDRGEAVRGWQQALRDRGQTSDDGRALAVDGVFGAKTEQAMRAWQRAHRPPLDEDGRGGPETWHSLLFA